MIYKLLQGSKLTDTQLNWNIATTRETAAKIEGYEPYLLFSDKTMEALAAKLMLQILDTETQLLQGANMFNYRRLSSQLQSLKNLYEQLRPYAIGSRYTPEEETILNKYDKFPKMFNNTFKDLKVRTIVDQKGNGWFEVNIPSNILNMLLQYKKGGKIRKAQNGLVLPDNGYQVSLDYNNLSLLDKFKRNYRIAKQLFLRGPNIENVGNAISALFGGYTPKNPYLSTGEPPAVGIKNLENLIKTSRIVREFNEVIKGPINLHRLLGNFIEKFITNPKGSGKLIHYDKGNGKSIYQENRGASIINGKLIPGKTKREGLKDYTWWNTDNPYMNVHKAKEGPFSPTRYIVVNENALFKHPFDLKEPVGQSAGKGRGFIIKTERVTDKPVDLTNAEIYEKSPFGWWEKIKVLPTPEITKNKQSRLISLDTYPLYRGPRFNINEVVNSDGTVNPRKAMLVLHIVAKQFGKGAYKMEHRLENPAWHEEDPNTYEHTKRVALSAWRIPTPEGYTKLDLMIAALGHDFGKIVSGDGHAQIGADLAKQVFIGIKPHLLQAIEEHMGQPTTQLGKVTKAADILNGRNFNYLLLVSPELYNKIFQKSAESNNSKPNVYVMDNFKWKELTYPSYINHVWNKLKAKGIKTDPYDRSNTNELTRMNFFNGGFNPVFKIYPLNNLKAHAQEILRRMKNIGLDVDNTMGELPLYGKRSIRDLVNLNSGRTSYVGYYNKPGVTGTFFHNNGTSIVDPGYPLDEINPLQSIVTIMHHERNMHGTLKFLTPEMWKLYEDFLKKMFTKTTTDEFGRTVAITTDNSTIPISKGSLKNEELRATIGEIVKNMYDNHAYHRAVIKNPNVKKYDLETLRPHFEKAVDEIPNERLSYILSNTNGYGADYAKIGPKENPKFFDELRTLLKIAPASLPFLIPRKEVNYDNVFKRWK